MDASKSFIKIHNISPQLAEDFEFDYDTISADLGSDAILESLVPRYSDWGGIGWMELNEYEYNLHNQNMHLTLATETLPPVEWLRNASINTRYFENKLITMTTIQKDETLVTGVAIMDGEVIQNKTIFELAPEEVEKYYDESVNDYNLDDLDNQIWDSIAKFVTVCEQFYLEGDKEND